MKKGIKNLLSQNEDRNLHHNFAWFVKNSATAMF